MAKLHISCDTCGDLFDVEEANLGLDDGHTLEDWMIREYMCSECWEKEEGAIAYRNKLEREEGY